MGAIIMVGYLFFDGFTSTVQVSSVYVRAFVSMRVLSSREKTFTWDLGRNIKYCVCVGTRTH